MEQDTLKLRELIKQLEEQGGYGERSEKAAHSIFLGTLRKIENDGTIEGEPALMRIAKDLPLSVLSSDFLEEASKLGIFSDVKSKNISRRIG